MKKRKNEEFNKKINIFKKIIIISIYILIIYFLYITVIRKEYYTDKLNNIINTSYISKSAPRGRIYDRNYNLIVDNKLVPIISYLMPKNALSSDLVNISKKLASLIDIDYSKLSIKNLKVIED